jgi:hypothetical protein
VQFAQSRDGRPVMVTAFAYAEGAAWWPARVKVHALLLAFALLQIAPWWAAIVFAVAAFFRQRVVAPDLVVWPAVAGLCVLAFPRLFFEAAMRDVLGVAHPLTIAICATTIVFALASGAGVASAVRWSFRPGRPSLPARLVPMLAAVAALVLTAWAGAHGVIGLRTWAW